MRRKGEKGFTLIEITIILLVLVILGAILLPMAERYIDLARLARVREDVGALASVIEMFKVDSCVTFFKQDGTSNAQTSANRVDLLVSSVGDKANNSAPGVFSVLWDSTINPTAPGNGDAFPTDTIDNHLALGDPFNSNPGNPYPRPTGSNPYACGYRGAYIQTPVQADPWGNRYMINVAFLGPYDVNRAFGLTSDQFRQKDVFVLSAGPDETINTGLIVDGVVAQGDDQIAVVSGGQ